ncbi:MAG: hypothetical protein ACKVS6_04860 [Planctomycetota bacterium]
MSKILITALFVAVPFALSSVQGGSGTSGPITFPPIPPVPVPPSACNNFFPQEPLVVFDISGYSLTGLIHQHVAIYSSGLVSISAAGGGTQLFPFSSKADAVFLQTSAVEKLWNKVIQAGAMTICDENAFVSDMPLTTVTVHRGATNSASHTYSYYFPMSPESTAVANHIQDFINTHFPNF